jgi:hypothetical protein
VVVIALARIEITFIHCRLDVIWRNQFLLNNWVGALGSGSTFVQDWFHRIDVCSVMMLLVVCIRTAERIITICTRRWTGSRFVRKGDRHWMQINSDDITDLRMVN